MTQKLCIKKQCERCPRVEEEFLTVEEVQKQGFHLDAGHSCRMVIDGAEIGSFGHLCSNCKEVVLKYAASIFTPLEKVSSTRRSKEEIPEDEGGFVISNDD